MTKNSQKSNFKKVFQVELKNVSDDIVSMRFRFIGGGSTVIGINTDRAEYLISQIDEALANSSEFFIAPDGRRFEISEKLLRSIRASLQTFYAKSRGGSDAQVLAGGSSEQLFKADKTHAEASAPSRLGARQISKRDKVSCCFPHRKACAASFFSAQASTFSTPKFSVKIKLQSKNNDCLSPVTSRNGKVSSPVATHDVRRFNQTKQRSKNEKMDK